MSTFDLIVIGELIVLGLILVCAWGWLLNLADAELRRRRVLKIIRRRLEED